MLEIGKNLMEERVKQGLSLEDVAQKTRFSVTQIEALEKGDLDYFKDDISYVKFFIQYYCKALNLEFSEFRDALDQSMITYTNMLSEKEVEEIRRSNEQIQKKIKQSQVKKSSKKRLKKLDFSLVSMFVIVLFLVGALGFVMGNYIFPSIMNPQEEEEIPRVSDTTLPDITLDPNGSLDTPVEPKKCEIVFSMVNSREYEIRNVNGCESIPVRVEFNAAKTWVRFDINGVEDANVQSTIYKAGDIIETSLKTNDELKLHLGYYYGNKFFVNNEEVNLDSSVGNLVSGDVIYFRVKGE